MVFRLVKNIKIPLNYIVIKCFKEALWQKYDVVLLCQLSLQYTVVSEGGVLRVITPLVQLNFIFNEIFNG